MGDVLVRLVNDFASDAATAAPAATEPRDQHVLLPSGSLALNASLIAELQRLRPGEKLSKDRLKRVATKQLPALGQTPEAGPSNAPTVDDRDAEPDELAVGDDFAIAFNMRDKGKDYRVQY
jgi:hypothetical protein